MADHRYERYRWVTDGVVTSYSNAGCLTIVSGMSSDDAVRAVGADPTRPVTPEERSGVDGLGYVSVAGLEEATSDKAVVLIEDNGWEGSRPEVLKRLSKKGKAAAVFWNVNGMVIFTCARRGKVLASLELPDADLDGDVPATLRRVLERAPEDTDPVALALMLAERFSGVALQQLPAVAQPSIAYPVTERVLALWASRDELLRLQMPSPAVAEAAGSASPIQRRSLAEWAALRALERADIATAPQVAGALAQFGTGGPITMGPETDAFRRETNRWSMEAATALAVGDHRRADELRYWNSRHWAMEALAYTAAPDDLTAALGATYCASVPYGDHTQSFLNAALEVLAT